jgi:hypothetical protein
VAEYDATERDPLWNPFITAPLHPQYPCSHCVQAGVIGAPAVQRFLAD